MTVTVSCSVEGCPRPHYAKGNCRAHYKRVKAGRTRLPPAIRKKVKGGRTCKVEGCGEPAHANDLCHKHHQRWRSHGDVSVTNRPGRDYHCKTTGYVRRRVGKKLVFVHRLEMEEMLGRPLLPGEEVHHKNGIKSDNRHRNLELWSKSQPSGQRVEDKVAWAIELLQLYKPEALR